MRWILWPLLVLVPCGVFASIPADKKLGAWRIGTISSVSGTGDDDVVVSLAQQHSDPDGAHRAQIMLRRWGSEPVEVSFYLNECRGDDAFTASYRVEARTMWGMSARQLAARIKADLKTWSAQARLSCGDVPVLDKFRLDHLNEAAAMFRSLVGSPG